MKKSNREILGLMSYVALLVFAVSFILSRIGTNMEFFKWLGSILLLVVAIVLGKEYADRLSNTWKIIFYVVAILAVIVFFLGFFPLR